MSRRRVTAVLAIAVASVVLIVAWYMDSQSTECVSCVTVDAALLPQAVPPDEQYGYELIECVEIDTDVTNEQGEPLGWVLTARNQRYIMNANPLVTMLREKGAPEDPLWRPSDTSQKPLWTNVYGRVWQADGEPYPRIDISCVISWVRNGHLYTNGPVCPEDPFLRSW